MPRAIGSIFRLKRHRIQAGMASTRVTDAQVGVTVPAAGPPQRGRHYTLLPCVLGRGSPLYLRAGQ
jgi:hypothetical protein